MSEFQTVALNEEQQRRLRAAVLTAREFSPRGYWYFYWLVHRFDIPKHAFKWVQKFFDARDRGHDVVNLAFRGSTKTTTWDTFAAWITGIRPWGSSLLVRGEERIATTSASFIARMIEKNPMWLQVFPHVRPNPAGPWGTSNGYEVIDTGMQPGEWERLNSDRHDPSIYSLPYTSKSLQGRHPSNLLLIDDIHTQDNTTSEREMQKVRIAVSDVLMPGRMASTMTMVVGTPWVEHDVYHRLSENPQFETIKTPVIDEFGVPTWPEVWPLERIEAERKADIRGGAAFARMYLLDVSPREGRRFRYQQMDSGLINASWNMYGGIDYASVPIFQTAGVGRSHFALGYVAELPTGGAVVYDGIVNQWTRDEGIMAALRAQQTFENWKFCGVESDGKGEEFITDLRKFPELKVMPMGTKGVPKPKRLEDYLGPLFNSGQLRISNAESVFLDTVRRFLNQYPNVTKNDSGWDCLDSIYYAVRMIPGLIKSFDAGSRTSGRRKVTQSPWSNLRSRR